MASYRIFFIPIGTPENRSVVVRALDIEANAEDEIRFDDWAKLRTALVNADLPEPQISSLHDPLLKGETRELGGTGPVQQFTVDKAFLVNLGFFE